MPEGFERGEDISFPVFVLDEDGAPVDTSDGTLTVFVRWRNRLHYTLNVGTGLTVLNHTPAAGEPQARGDLTDTQTAAMPHGWVPKVQTKFVDAFGAITLMPEEYLDGAVRRGLTMSLGHIGGGGPLPGPVTLSNTSYAENGIQGTTIGIPTLLNWSGPVTFSLLDSLNGRLQYAGGEYQVGPSRTNFEVTPTVTLRSEAALGGEGAGIFVRTDIPLTVIDVDPESEFFVDSVNGDDGNSGSSTAAAFQTLGQIPWDNNIGVSLSYASHWREGIDLIDTDGVTFLAYGSVGDLPLIDGSDVVAIWTAHAIEPNCWESPPITHDGFATDRITVYEDDVLMKRFEDLGDLTAGSFEDAHASDGNPLTIRIKATGLGNPNSNGKVYEVSTRRAVVRLGDGATVEGLHTRRNMLNNGSCEVGRNSVIRRWLAQDGTKHSFLIGSGLVEDSIACRIDAVTTYELSSTMFVAFTEDGTGEEITFKRCFAVADIAGNPNGGASIAQIQHDNLGNQYAVFTGEMLGSVDNQTGWGPNAEVISINGMFTRRTTFPLAARTADGTIDHFQCIVTASQNYVIPQGGEGIIRFRHNAFYASGISSNPMFRIDSDMDGGILDLQHMVFYMAAARNVIVNLSWSDGTLRVNNSIFVYPNGGSPIEVPVGVTYEGDNNVFLANADDELVLVYHGVTYNTLAAWQAATGQDANSIALGSSDLPTLFAGTVSAGDFTLSSSGTGLTVAALEAGPQTHMDWNTRAVDVGPPTSWPVVPETLAQSKTYVRNPEAWTF